MGELCVDHGLSEALPVDADDLDDDGDRAEITPIDIQSEARLAGEQVDMGAREFHRGWLLFARGQFDQVELVFGEKMDPVSTGEPGNYSIDNGVAVNSASLQPNGYSVVLNTSPLTPCAEHRVTVNDVYDELDNAIIPNTDISFISGPDETIEGPILLNDTFEDNQTLIELQGGVDETIIGWRKFDQTDQEGPSDWVEEEGRMNQYSNIYWDKTGEEQGDIDRLGTYAFWNSPGAGGWTDYTFSVSACNQTDNDGLGIMFRYQDDNNYYKLELDLEDTFRRLTRKSGGVNSELALESGNPGYEMGATIVLEVSVVGNRITIRQDGSVLFGGPVVDPAPLTSGTVALYSFASPDLYFDNARVVALTCPAPQPTP